MSLLRALPVVVVTSLAACTHYVSVPQGSGHWEQARQSVYGGSAAPPSTLSEGTSSPEATLAQAMTPSATTSASLDPKPLPPLVGASGGAVVVRDAPAYEPQVASAGTAQAANPEPLRAGPAPSSPRSTAQPAPVDPQPAAVTATPPRPEPPAAAEPAPLADPAPAVSERSVVAAATIDEGLTPPSLSGVGFLWPVPGDDPAAVDAAAHAGGGMVITTASGAPFVASENGVIVFAADALERYGKMVVVRHDGEYTTTYAQAARLDVAVGDVVRRGQRLGLVGAVGEADPARLYFEMRVGSRVVDPRAYLVGAPRLAAR